MKHLHFIPIHSPTRLQPFPLSAAILDCLQAAGEALQTGDILIISSKFAAIAEGRVVTLSEVQPSERARALADQYKMEAELAELVIQESEHIFGGIFGFLLSVKDNLIAPNAGIDHSNIPAGQVVLYPADSFATAERLRAELVAATGCELGVALSDSRLMPGRTGTTGVAVGVAGFDPVKDERGQPDLLGQPLKVTQKAIADNLCTGAELVMGEGAEGMPIVIARNSHTPLTQKSYTWRDLAIAWPEDIYIAILGGKLPPQA
jgi:coenzyme F420-0:L-glutamate ligase